MSEPTEDLGTQVLEHLRDNEGHSVLWETEGTLADARCQQCGWPN